MNIRRRIQLNNLLLGSMVVFAGISSLVTTTDLVARIDHVAGAGTQTLQAASAGAQNVEAALLSVERIVAEVDVADSRERLEAARVAMRSARDRLGAAGLLRTEAAVRLGEVSDRHQRELDELLVLHERITQTRRALRAHCDCLEAATARIQDVCDLLVERGLDSALVQKTFSEDLERLLALRDDASLSLVALLRQYYWIAKLDGGADVADVRDHLDERIDDHAAAMERVLLTREIRVNPLAAEVTSMLRDHASLLRGYLDLVTAFRQSRQDYLAGSVVLRRAFQEVLVQSESRIAGLREEAAAQGASARRSQQVTIAVAILLATAVGWALARRLQRRFAVVQARVDEIASGDGDLTARLETTDRDEFGMLCRGFNAFLDKLQALVRDVGEKAAEVAAASCQLEDTADTLAGGAARSSDHSAEVAAASQEAAVCVSAAERDSEAMRAQVATVFAAIEQMTASITRIADTADSGVRSADEAAEFARQGAERMAQLERSAQQIDAVVTTIEELAAQTNLLALNATIEAARAGEAGRGFAVVAGEVKALAQATASATVDIRALSERIRASNADSVQTMTRIDSTVALMRDNTRGLAIVVGEQRSSANEIAVAMGASLQSVDAVAHNLRQASSASRCVSTRMGDLDAGAKTTSHGASQTKDAGRSLSALASELQERLMQFRVR